MFLKRVLLKYWATYISITLFTVLLMLPIYVQSYNNVKKQQIDDMGALVQNQFSSFTTEYNAMRRIISALQKDPTFVLISKWSDHKDRINLFHYIDFQKTLLDTVAPSDLILDAHVLFDKSAYVVSKRAQALPREDFYAREFHYQDVDYAAWQNAIWAEHKPFLSAAPARYFQYLFSRAITFYFYSGVASKPSAAIGVVVSEQALLDRLLSQDVRQNGYLHLRTAEGDTLLDYQAEQIDGRMNTFSFTEASTGMVLEVGVSERVFIASTQATRNMLLTYIGIALTASLLLSFAYTVNVYRPVKTFYTKMQSEGLVLPNEKNFDKLLNVSLSGLLTRKQALEHALLDINQKHRDHLLTNIIHNLPVPQREIDGYLRDLPIFQAPYAVARYALMPVEGAEEMGLSVADISQVYRLLDEELQHAFAPGYLPLSAKRGALIAADAQTYDAKCAALEAVADSVRAAHACALVFAVSRVCDGTQALRGGYGEATQVLRFASMFDQPVIRMDQLGMLSSRYDIVVFQPEILLGQLVLSDTRSLEAYTDTLIEQLSDLHFARPRRAEQLYYNITDTCTAALLKHGLPAPPPAEYDATQEIGLTAQALRSMIAEVNRLIQESRKETPPKRENVLDYIKAHYQDPDLSLSELARTFFYSEGYIYQIVKKQTGLSYADYVNALRMDCACTLLKTTEHTAAEVAELSGFHNLNTFYKAFKKKFGIAPKAYRDQVDSERTKASM